MTFALGTRSRLHNGFSAPVDPANDLGHDWAIHKIAEILPRSFIGTEAFKRTWDSNASGNGERERQLRMPDFRTRLLVRVCLQFFALLPIFHPMPFFVII